MTSLDDKVQSLETQVHSLATSLDKMVEKVSSTQVQMATLAGSMSHMAQSVGELSSELRDWSHASSNRLRIIEAELSALKAVDAEREKIRNAQHTRVMMWCAVCSIIPTVVTVLTILNATHKV